MFTISNQTTMNPTGDKLTTELQQTTFIQPPVVVGQGEQKTFPEKLVSGVEFTGQKLVSGVEFTGQKIGEGLDTIASGVEFTGQKLVSGVGYTGEKLKETGELIGEKLGETGEKIADRVSEEKVELPGVVTLLQNGAARIFGHLTGSATKTSPVVNVERTAPISPILPDLKSDIKETVVHAEKNLSGDIITTDVQIGHFEKPTSRVDVIKQSGQLGPQSELHLPNLKVRDMPMNRAIEEPIPIHHVTPTEVQTGAQFIDTVEQKFTETVQQPTQFASFVYVHSQPEEQSLGGQAKVENQVQHQLPSLTSKVVLDGAAFIENSELQISNVQSKVDEQLPNLTTKAVHDGAMFLDQAEQQSKGTVNQSVDPMLPNLSTKDVHDGAMFLDVVENSGQSM